MDRCSTRVLQNLLQVRFQARTVCERHAGIVQGRNVGWRRQAYWDELTADTARIVQLSASGSTT